MVDVKICGIRSAEILDVALKAGADYIGLVFFPRSPRHIELHEAAALADQMRGQAKSVALTVNPDDDLLHEIDTIVQPDMIQLHGSESPERVAEIKTLLGRPVLKAVSVASQEDVMAANAYKEVAELILFDAKPLADPAALPGGNGVCFDWHILDAVPEKLPFMLSGGLTPENVAAAIRLTGCQAVDVSSGVERAPGVKDPARIRQFIRAARAASSPKS